MEKQETELLKYITQVREKMNEYKLMLCYRGVMTQEIVVALLSLTENKLTQDALSSSIRSRIFSVMVECLQNITQQSEKSTHSKANMFMVGMAEKGYMIYSGSVIKNSDVEELRDKIQEINTMSGDDLKKSYKNLILSDTLNEKPDIDLGLIHIARKTGNALDYNFEQIDSEHYFFSLNTLIDH